jgi:Fe/S biogenesis protein NfuA
MAATTEDLQANPIVTLTPEAYKVVKEALDQEMLSQGGEASRENASSESRGEAESAPIGPPAEQAPMALWLEVSGVQAGSFVYDLYFQASSDADDVDERVQQEEIELIVPARSIERLRGARLEWSDEGGGGLVLVNPNSPAPEEAAPSVPPEVLAQGVTGTLARRVIGVLEQSVNPAIASHGGRADLVALNEDDGTAYLRLSGGCQGCAMSQMTLRQGIESALLEEVPELTRILDVTDHDSGENPFY